MPAIGVVIPQLEGFVGSLTGVEQRDGAAFVEMCKYIMRQETLRNATDWNFTGSADVDESANNVLNGAGTLFGVLIGTDSADAELDLVVINDNTSNTLDGTAALDNEDIFATILPAAATDGTREYHPYLFPEGIAYATGITIGADGDDGTNPAANDIHAYLVYRG